MQYANLIEATTGNQGELLYSAKFLLDTTTTIHTYEETYSLLALLADFGGILQSLTAFLGLFLFAVSRQGFVVEMVEKVFRKRTGGSGGGTMLKPIRISVG